MWNTVNESWYGWVTGPNEWVQISSGALEGATGIAGANPYNAPRVSTYTGLQYYISPRWDNTDLLSLWNPTTGTTGTVFYSPTGAAGSPNDGQNLVIRIYGYTGIAVGWSGPYTAIGTTLPTSTTALKGTYIELKYNQITSNWDCLIVAQ